MVLHLFPALLPWEDQQQVLPQKEPQEPCRAGSSALILLSQIIKKESIYFLLWKTWIKTFAPSLLPYLAMHRPGKLPNEIEILLPCSFFFLQYLLVSYNTSGDLTLH